MENQMTIVEDIEKRFMEVAKIDPTVCVKLLKEKFPLPENTCLQIETDKEKSNLHGEVFTPLWFVDKMILKAKGSINKDITTHDLCAGYGQFTIRLIRYLSNKYKNKFQPNVWLEKKHSFSECQVSSAYKLLYIFGTKINLFVGDAVVLNKLRESDNGILFYCAQENKWINITEDIEKIFKRTKKFSIENENEFIKEYNKLVTKYEKDRKQKYWWELEHAS